MKSWTHVNKDDYAAGRGPWDNEPDKAVWVDESTGLDCMIHRNRSGALCGYVGVDETSPYFEVYYGDIDIDTATCVHGGLTYSDHCMEGTPEENGICHVPEDGRPDKIWWIGFDCAHLGDPCPKYDSDDTHVYRDWDFAKNEVRQLANKLHVPA